MRGLRTLRGRLTAIAFVVALVAIAVVTVAFNLLLARSLDHDVNHRLLAQAAAATTTVAEQGGRLTLRESPDDAVLDRQVWVYDGRRAIERAAAPAAVQGAADALAGHSREFRDLPGRELRLYAAPVNAGGRRAGTVVAGQSLAAYDRTTDLALVGSLTLGVLLLAAVLVLTSLLIGRALGRVRDLTRSAAEWSEHDDPRRFGSTPQPDELGELARTLDSMMDRVASSLRHEQRLSAELSHELRTPLARIIAEVELLERRERSPEARADAYAAIARSANQMNEILETLMAAARADAGLGTGRSELATTLQSLRRRWEESAAAPVALELDTGGSRLVAGVDREVIERILSPLLENGRRHARSRVRVDARSLDGRLVVTVTDDGPGIPADARERVFEPGVRLGNCDGSGGAGLGLPLARRLARAAGGDVTVEPPRAGGAVVRVDLPG
jgi:signal transduction histidine kinase